MPGVTVERAIALPKTHPARFLALYGAAVPSTRAAVREGERLLWYIRHPFAADLAACADTNS